MKSNSAQFAPRAKKLVERLSHWALALGMGWIMVMMFLITLDVAGRYFFTKPVPGGIEMSEFMLAVFGILGMAYTHMAGGNVKVTMFTRALPARLKYLAETLSHLLSLQIIFFLSLYGIVSGMDEYTAGTTTDTLAIPIYPLYFLLSLGAGLLCLVILINIRESISNFLNTRHKLKM
jgi:TRAP-type transport system small permease protein